MCKVSSGNVFKFEWNGTVAVITVNPEVLKSLLGWVWVTHRDQEYQCLYYADRVRNSPSSQFVKTGLPTGSYCQESTIGEGSRSRKGKISQPPV